MTAPAIAPDAAPLTSPAPGSWPLWQRVLFRFFFVYLLLQAAPWYWFGRIPGVSFVNQLYSQAVNWAVTIANARVFHVAETLVPLNGSGDTSWGWTMTWLFLSVSVIACVVWSVLDRKRAGYDRLLYWLRTIVRYYLATYALSYGIIKIFALQMTFPTLSQLATPLGDFLPMRFSWLFIGYSFPYQVFSGIMETTAGLLLLNRRTITAGLFAAMGAFLNVVMINLSYDVPVKIFASHLLFSSMFLLALDYKRVLGFMVLNTSVPPTNAWTPRYAQPWHRWVAVGTKIFILYGILWLPLKNGRTRYLAANAPAVQGPFRSGVYDVRQYIVNGDTIPAATSDTLRWNNVIIDNALAGSVDTRDGVFWQRYRRGYFRYKPDTALRTVTVWKISTIPRDSTFLFTMRYEVPDTSTIRWHTKIRNDSVHVELVRVPRHFQLTERQFHWISEYNR